MMRVIFQRARIRCVMGANVKSFLLHHDPKHYTSTYTLLRTALQSTKSTTYYHLAHTTKSTEALPKTQKAL
jgi:hypothetical protein